MKLYYTIKGIVLEHDAALFVIDEPWDKLVNRDNLESYLLTKFKTAKQLTAAEKAEWLTDASLLPPISRQEVWAAGVTYLKSRDARMEESEGSGAASLYDKVYDAERPELFFKAAASRVSGHGQQVYIRKDSAWNVPEPELTLFINSKGIIQGYTIGNDMSSRSIEGENALYLPQAKIYEKSAAIGPCLYVSSSPIGGETAIKLKIKRGGIAIYTEETTVSRIKRSFDELVTYLYSECDFNYGCYLMTGTCLVPPAGFTLQTGDEIEITIDKIGTLVNTVALNPKHKS
ncbi:fumarylacetoacetate hydrolase family protein [Mucilaginibacter xinganensis]|uniref:2-hydroxyhepta-2,4-diene-1,7-dioate isomerase n=1 Tax=Mucilaginibacter xinganensis TaxID=1234841 RepID=A0A223NYP1_9SPHI|nr:fumarylacetoacetate hydrolase family protein [Mucilaginibacter xinganensis]ASU34997.1 2-hydroxyhepta-2,4-diene-1,7-dioate isomerase [Mucilaginibacter xinganensis]